MYIYSCVCACPIILIRAAGPLLSGIRCKSITMYSTPSQRNKKGECALKRKDSVKGRATGWAQVHQLCQQRMHQKLIFEWSRATQINTLHSVFDDSAKVSHHVSRLWIHNFSCKKVSRRGYKEKACHVQIYCIIWRRTQLVEWSDIMSLALPSHRGHDYFTSLCTEGRPGRAGCVMLRIHSRAMLKRQWRQSLSLQVAKVRI